MSERDALTEVLDAVSQRGHGQTFLAPFFRGVVDLVLAAGWRPPTRKIETADELDVLQPAQALLDANMDGRNDLAAVIRDDRGRVYTRDMDNLADELDKGRPAGWWETGTDRDDRDSHTMAYPVTVLLNPTEESDNA
ncbi:hypothetical protein ACFWU5_16600 [Nocardia sp. NPDC058640]|uniref:hypothetical protein n=1 Tax=Nocardia sp. NPDC058640 TaxID=3346571 RepID=UPI003666A185